MSSHEMSAHDWNVLGKEERIRRWPSKIGEKRPLRVEITSWVGISIGAKHTYVKVKEANNGWWCEDENCWVELSCDSEKGGYSLEASVNNEDEAVALAKHFVELVAGKKRKNHDIRWEGLGRPRWIK